MLNELTLGEKFADTLVEVYEICPIEEDYWHNDGKLREVIVRDSTAYIHLRYSRLCIESPSGDLTPGKTYMISGECWPNWPTRCHPTNAYALLLMSTASKAGHAFTMS